VQALPPQGKCACVVLRHCHPLVSPTVLCWVRCHLRVLSSVF